MIQWLLVPLGLTLIVLSAADVLRTVVSVGATAGPLTARFAHGIWQVVLRLRPLGHRALYTTGLTLVLLAIATWILLAWAGWFLVFNADPQAVVTTDDLRPGDVWDRLYFSGYALFTLGNGDFRPYGWPWQLATVAAAGNGFVLMTLGLAYVVSLVSAVAHKRQIAGYLASLGETPPEILLRAWDGERFRGVELHFVTLVAEVELLQQHHFMYPVVHYFHSTRPRLAATIRIAALDEALTVLAYGVDPSARAPDSVVVPLREAITDFLDSVATSFVEPAAEPPPPPIVAPLRDKGIPVLPQAELDRAVASLRHRRRILLGLVNHDGWEWEDVGRETPLALDPSR